MGHHFWPRLYYVYTRKNKGVTGANLTRQKSFDGWYVTHHLHALHKVELSRHGASLRGGSHWSSVTRPIERIYACVLYSVLYKQRRNALPLSAATRSDYSTLKSSHLSTILWPEPLSEAWQGVSVEKSKLVGGPHFTPTLDCALPNQSTLL